LGGHPFSAALATELSADIKLISAHLKTLKVARLVIFRREGKYVVHRLTSGDRAGLVVTLRQVAGYENVRILQGRYAEWKSKGGFDAAARATGPVKH